MEFTKLNLSLYGDYFCKESSNIEMDILGTFLMSDVRDWFPSIFREWALDDKLGEACSGNITALEKDGEYIELTDMISEEDIPTILKMTRKELVYVIDAWEKICELKPKEVIIKYENDEFIVETKN